jgi:hypothetical protein
MKKIAVLILLVLSAGCAATPPPDWLGSRPADYPAVRYLSGRGEGETAGLARDRARADLAKTFEVALRESSSDSLQWQQGAGRQAGLQTSIRREISTQTSQVIKGVEIAETWRADDPGAYHALAVLDRIKAGTLLRAEIAALDAETARNLELARWEEVLPEKISAAYNALYAQLRRRHPQKMLQIVDPTGIGLPPNYQLAALQSDFESLLDRWRIGMRVERDQLGGLASILAGALGNSGISFQADESQADYQLRADLGSEKLATADGWHWVRGTLRISLLENHSGNVLGSHQWSYKSSAQQAEMAVIRARDQLTTQLRQELFGVLVEIGDVPEKEIP